MRRIIKTEAVCLRVRNWRNSSKIVTLLTPNLGLVTAIARGARRPKSLFGAALELFALSEVTIYLRENRELATVSNAELINAHPHIPLNYNAFLSAGQIARFLLRALAHHNSEPRVFQLLKNTLLALSTPPKEPTDYSGLIGAFFLKATSFLGFRPELQKCIQCRTLLCFDLHTPPLHFSFQKGGVICPHCQEQIKGKEGVKRPDVSILMPQAFSVNLPAQEILLLNTLLHTPVLQLIDKKIPEQTLQLILNYASFHLNIKN